MHNLAIDLLFGCTKIISCFLSIYSFRFHRPFHYYSLPLKRAAFSQCHYAFSSLSSYFVSVHSLFSLILFLHPYIKQTPWPLVRKRTIPTERPPLAGKI
jgi:hypothetical protein